MENVEQWVALVLPYLTLGNIMMVVTVLAGLVSAAASGELRTFARTTVAAVYRASLKAAEQLQEEGLDWLLSPAGVDYRRMLVGRAYDLMPATVYGLPLGRVLKLVVSRDRFCTMVERAFVEMVEVAARIDATRDDVFKAEQNPTE